jgi:CheY-like chemotaxis protein
VSESMQKAKRVLSVGQCFADHSGIARVLSGAFGAEVIGADSAREALERLRQKKFALVLVNRVLDADGASGLELIRALKAEEQLRDVPVLADAGSASEPNHRHTREKRGVRSFMPATAGRPTAKLPSGRYRRRRKQRLNKA